jgi:hypothetical protein
MPGTLQSSLLRGAQPTQTPPRKLTRDARSIVSFDAVALSRDVSTSQDLGTMHASVDAGRMCMSMDTRSQSLDDLQSGVEITQPLSRGSGVSLGSLRSSRASYNSEDPGNDDNVVYHDFLTADGAAHLAADLATEVADEMKHAAQDALTWVWRLSSKMSQTKGKLELRGDSLGLLAPDNPARIVLAYIIQHPLVEFFLLFLIFLNLLSLAATSPGSDLDLTLLTGNGTMLDPGNASFNETMENFNLFCAVVFTIEAIVRIMVMGFYQAKGSYLRNGWNVFDLLLVIFIWVSITMAQILRLDDDAGFALSVLRTLRLMRFFRGIRELMEAVALGYKMLFSILGLLSYAWVIGGVIGMELFSGVVSRECISGTVEERSPVDCPRMLSCDEFGDEKCYEVLKAVEGSQDRNTHIDRIGFDTIGDAFVTEFQITVMDDWADLAQPIINSDSSTNAFVFPLFFAIVIFVSMLIVNLFLAAMTFSFLQVRQDNRGDSYTLRLFKEADQDEDGVLNRKELSDLAQNLGHNLTEEQLDAAMAEMDDDDSGAVDFEEFKEWYNNSISKQKSLQESLADIVNEGIMDSAGGKGHYFFPMHPSYTPRCQQIATSRSFTSFVDFTVFVNTVVMAMDGHNVAEWIQDFSFVANFVFVFIYSVELMVKAGALGFRPYFRSRLNKLDFFIVSSSYVGFYLLAFGNDEDAVSADALNAIQLLRVLRIAKLVFRLRYLRELLELAFSSSKALWSLVMFLMFMVTLFGIIGMHLFASKCHESGTLPPTSFGSFSGSVLALFQIITNDNFGGIMYYYMECYHSGPMVVSFFGVAYIICNYVIVNLFMAVFVENFELSDEIKAARQEENYRAKKDEEAAQDGLIDEPTKLVQMKALQFSLFLDRTTKKHVFQRMSKFGDIAMSSLMVKQSNLTVLSAALVEQLRAADPELLASRPDVQLLLAATEDAVAAEHAAKKKHLQLLQQLEDLDIDDLERAAIGVHDDQSEPDEGSTQQREELLQQVTEAADEHADAEDNMIKVQKALVDAGEAVTDITGIAMPQGLLSLTGVLSMAKKAAADAQNLAIGARDHVSISNAIHMAKEAKHVAMDAKDMAMKAALDTREAARDARDAVTAVKDAAETKAREAAQRAKHAAEQAHQMAKEARDGAERRARAAKESVEAAAREAFEAAQQAKADLEQAAHDATRKAIDAAKEVKQQAETAATAAMHGDFDALTSQFENNMNNVKGEAFSNMDRLFEFDEQALMEQNEAMFSCLMLNDESLGLFKPDHPARMLCTRIVNFELPLCTSRKRRGAVFVVTFDKVMLGFVFLSSLVLAAEGPENKVHDPAWLGDLLAFLDWTCFVAFFAECGLKIVSMGFILTPTAYLLSKWNWLDFAVVISSIFDLMATIIGVENTFAKMLRLLRILRPLKLLRLIDGMHVVLEALTSIIPAVLGIGLCFVVAFTTFGILGVSFFRGRMFRCGDDISLDQVECEAAYPGAWQNPDFSFDNIFDAYRTLFYVWTGDDWGRIVHACMDQPEKIGQPPSPGESKGLVIYVYFIAFLICCVFMLKGLFIACLVDLFAQSSGSALATESQKQWIMLQLVLRNIRQTQEPPKRRYLCFPSVFRKLLYWITTSAPWNFTINVSIVVATAVLLLPINLWPEGVTQWFVELNIAILMLWTLEFVLKTIAFGYSKYFASAKLDCMIIPLLWLADILAFINAFLPAIGQHLEFLNFLAGLQFLRVLRLTRLLTRITRLRSLFATVELSLMQAKNIMIIIALVVFIWGVAGMKIYGNVCSRATHEYDSSEGKMMPSSSSAKFVSGCEVINVRASFESITKAMRLMFELATNQDASPVIRDIKANTDSSSWVTPFFATFYVVSNFILLNLFVAAIVENYELGVAADKFDVNKNDIEHLHAQWDACGHSYKLGILLRDVRFFVENLTGRFALIGDIDKRWYNRFLIELQTELGIEPDLDTTRVPFSQLVLGLCLIWFGPNCLQYEERQRMLERHAEKREEFARSMLRASIRAWIANRSPPPELQDIPSAKWRRATRSGLLMMLVVIINKYKLTKLDDVEKSKRLLLSDGDLLDQLEDAVKSTGASSLSALKRAFVGSENRQYRSGDRMQSRDALASLDELTSTDSTAGVRKRKPKRRWRRSGDDSGTGSSSDDSNNAVSSDAATMLDSSDSTADIGRLSPVDETRGKHISIRGGKSSRERSRRDVDVFEGDTGNGLGFDNPIFDVEQPQDQIFDVEQRQRAKKNGKRSKPLQGKLAAGGATFDLDSSDDAMTFDVESSRDDHQSSNDGMNSTFPTAAANPVLYHAPRPAFDVGERGHHHRGATSGRARRLAHKHGPAGSSSVSSLPSAEATAKVDTGPSSASVLPGAAEAPSSDAPAYVLYRYRAMAPGIIRRDVAVDSPKVGTLVMGEEVPVTARVALAHCDRVKTDRGWASVTSKTGKILLQLMAVGDAPVEFSPVHVPVHSTQATDTFWQDRSDDSTASDEEPEDARS